MRGKSGTAVYRKDPTITLILSKDKEQIIEQLRNFYIKVINDNKEARPIKIINHDNTIEFNFSLPIQLGAFIQGLQFTSRS